MVTARSTWKMSADISAISLPEFVSVSDFIERTDTLSYMADTSVLRMRTDIT